MPLFKMRSPSGSPCWGQAAWVGLGPASLDTAVSAPRPPGLPHFLCGCRGESQGLRGQGITGVARTPCRCHAREAFSHSGKRGWFGGATATLGVRGPALSHPQSLAVCPCEPSTRHPGQRPPRPASPACSLGHRTISGPLGTFALQDSFFHKHTRKVLFHNCVGRKGNGSRLDSLLCICYSYIHSFLLILREK